MAVGGGLALAGCAGGEGATPTASGSAASSPSDTPSDPTSSGTSSTGGSPSTTSSRSATTSSTTSTSTTSTSTTASNGPGACAARVAGRLTTPQRVGQLFVVALDASAGRSGLDALIAGQHVGGVVYLGGWQGLQTVAAASEHVQGQATATATGSVGMFVAADQEGGQVQQLTGAGFTTIPSATVQGDMSPAALRDAAAGWGSELARAGVNVDLAPVADTVPASIGTANGPIGRYHREYGSDPTTVARHVAAFTRGLRRADVTATVKHFPGLGRVSSNTDTSSTGVTDPRTGRDDPYLRPFTAGTSAGAGMVMMSSARYPRIDDASPAVFSRAVVTGLLRDRLGWSGVVVTDDVGAAAAVQSVPVGKRATRFLDAGGDLVLTADPQTVAPMAAAVTSRVARDAAFAGRVRAAVQRVLTLKARTGLLPCPR